MKKKLFILIGIFVFLIPFTVDAKTTKECTYRVESGLSTNSVMQANLKCTLNWEKPSFFGLFGGFSYSCKIVRDATGDGYSDITIVPVNATKSRDTGFNLSNWFEENTKCPSYAVVDVSILDKNEGRSTYSVFFADTMTQVNKIKDIGPGLIKTHVSISASERANLSHFMETNKRNEEAENNPDSEAARECVSKKEALDNAIALLQANRDKLIEMNCQNYVLSDEERDTVASPDNIKWGRECQQITDTYNVTVSSARSELNNYVQAGCLEADSSVYNEYNDKINNLQQEVEEIDNNIEEQNTRPTDEEREWEELGDGIEIDTTTIGCGDIFGTEEGSFGWLLTTILGYIRVIGPILVVLLSAIDFIKAVVGFDEKAMKEAQNKLIIRLVCAVALFLAPTLVQLLFSFINETVCTLN